MPHPVYHSYKVNILALSSIPAFPLIQKTNYCVGCGSVYLFLDKINHIVYELNFIIKVFSLYKTIFEKLSLKTSVVHIKL